jgi:hypothetical protein
MRLLVCALPSPATSERSMPVSPIERGLGRSAQGADRARLRWSQVLPTRCVVEPCLSFARTFENHESQWVGLGWEVVASVGLVGARQTSDRSLPSSPRSQDLTLLLTGKHAAASRHKAPLAKRGCWHVGGEWLRVFPGVHPTRDLALRPWHMRAPILRRLPDPVCVPVHDSVWE